MDVCIFHGFLLKFHLKFGILLWNNRRCSARLQRISPEVHVVFIMATIAIRNQLNIKFADHFPIVTAENLIDIVGVLRIHNRILCGYATLASIIMYAGFWQRFRGQAVGRGFGKHRNRWQNKRIIAIC